MTNFITRAARRWIKNAVQEALREHSDDSNAAAPAPAEHPATTVTARQAADILGISPKTVANNCNAGKIRAHKDELGQWRIPIHELHDGPLTNITPRPPKNTK